MRSNSASRAISALLGLLLVFGSSIGAWAFDVYSATTFVTGERDETRLPGIERAFRQVLVKVSGTTQILQAKSLETYVSRSSEYVAGFYYRDRMEGIPHHDEQGSRDRPYDLTVEFYPDEIDQVVAVLGFHKWKVPRQRIVPLVRVEFQERSLSLANDATEGRDQREALLAAAERMGVPVVLPDRVQLDRLTKVGEAKSRPDDLAHQIGGDILLEGALVWDAGSLHWTSHWMIMTKRGVVQWDMTSVTFDEAFRNSFGNAAEVLSGQY